MPRPAPKCQALQKVPDSGRQKGGACELRLPMLSTRQPGNFQGRYVLRHAGKARPPVMLGKNISKTSPPPQSPLETEASTLANLTGWNVEDLYKKASAQT